jgi:hypothetical protein
MTYNVQDSRQLLDAMIFPSLIILVFYVSSLYAYVDISAEYTKTQPQTSDQKLPREEESVA